MNIPLFPLGLLGTIVQAIEQAIVGIMLDVWGFMLNLMGGVFEIISLYILRTPYPKSGGSGAPVLFDCTGGCGSPWSSIWTTFQSVRVMAVVLLLLSLTIVAFGNVFEGYFDIVDEDALKDIFVTFFFIMLWWPIGVSILALADSLSAFVMLVGTEGSSGSGGGITGILETVESTAEKANNEGKLGIGTVIIMIIILLLELLILIGIAIIWTIRVLLIFVLMPSMPLLLALKSFSVPALKDLQQIGNVGFSLFVTLAFITVPGAILIAFTGSVLSSLFDTVDKVGGSDVGDIDPTKDTSATMDTGSSTISQTADLQSEGVEVISSPVSSFNDVLVNSQINSDPTLLQGGGGSGPSGLTVSLLIIVGMSVPIIAGILPLLLVRYINFNPAGSRGIRKIGNVAEDKGKKAAKVGAEKGKTAASRGTTSLTRAGMADDTTQALKNEMRGGYSNLKDNMSESVEDYAKQAEERIPGTDTAREIRDINKEFDEAESDEARAIVGRTEDASDVRAVAGGVGQSKVTDLLSEQGMFKRGSIDEEDVIRGIENADDKKEAEKAARLMTGADQQDRVEELESEIDKAVTETEDGVEIDEEQVEEITEEFGVREDEELVRGVEDYMEEVEEMKQEVMKEKSEPIIDELQDNNLDEETAVAVAEAAMKTDAGENVKDNIEDDEVKNAFENEAENDVSLDELKGDKVQEEVKSEIQNDNRFDQEEKQLLSEAVDNSDQEVIVEDKKLMDAADALEQSAVRYNDVGEEIEELNGTLEDPTHYEEEKEMIQDTMEMLRERDSESFTDDDLRKLSEMAENENETLTEADLRANLDVEGTLSQMNIAASSEHSRQVNNSISAADAQQIQANIENKSAKRKRMQDELEDIDDDDYDINI